LEQLAQANGVDISKQVDEAINDLINAVSESHSDYDKHSIGSAVVSTTGSMVAIRRGHLKVSSDVLGTLSGLEADALYDSCGYERDASGEWVPARNSLLLGYVKIAKDGTLFAAIESTNFKAIKAQSGGAIPTSTSGASAFRAVREEGFAPDGISWKKDKNRDYLTSVNTGSGTTRDCVPIILADLLAGRKVSVEELTESENYCFLSKL